MEKDKKIVAPEVPVQDQNKININELRSENGLNPIPNGDIDLIPKEIKLCEIRNFNSIIPTNILEEIQMYSNCRVENKAIGNQVLQRYYVPKDEYIFYENWEKTLRNQLLNSTQNAVLIKNIARRHKIKLQK